jgi:hypothetical protein
MTGPMSADRIAELTQRIARDSAELANLLNGARITTPRPRDVDRALLDAVLQHLTEHGDASGSTLARQLGRRQGDVFGACRALADRGEINRDGNTWTLTNASANGTADTRNAEPETTPTRAVADARSATDSDRAGTPDPHTRDVLRAQGHGRHVGHVSQPHDTNHDDDNSAKPGLRVCEQVESGS